MQNYSQKYWLSINAKEKWLSSDPDGITGNMFVMRYEKRLFFKQFWLCRSSILDRYFGSGQFFHMSFSDRRNMSSELPQIVTKTSNSRAVFLMGGTEQKIGNGKMITLVLMSVRI